MYRTYLQKSDVCREISLLGAHIRTPKTATVLLHFAEFYGDGIPQSLCFPFENNEGTRIRYSINLLRKETDIDPEKVDYLITHNPVESSLFEEVHQTNFFRLYKIRSPHAFHNKHR
jgi:hypothetical protein